MGILLTGLNTKAKLRAIRNANEEAESARRRWLDHLIALGANNDDLMYILTTDWRNIPVHYWRNHAL